MPDGIVRAVAEVGVRVKSVGVVGGTMGAIMATSKARDVLGANLVSPV